MNEFYMGLTDEELLDAYRAAVKNNADYRWIKGTDSVGYTTEIRQIEDELLRRLQKRR